MREVDKVSTLDACFLAGTAINLNDKSEGFVTHIQTVN